MSFRVHLCAICIIGTICAVQAAVAKSLPQVPGLTSGDASILNLASETVLGRWCDTMVPGNSKFRREIKIVISNAGTVAETKLFDGSQRTMNLRERGGGVFAVVGSSSGDAFRISGGTGDLQLLDRDGYIRSARRLENNSAGGDCVR